MSPACHSAARSGGRDLPAARLTASICMVLAAGACVLEAAEPAAGTSGAVLQRKAGDTLRPVQAPILFRGAAPGKTSGLSAFQLAADIQIDPSSLLSQPEPSSTLLKQYSDALSRESRRSMERDPSVFWSDLSNDLSDDEGYLEQRARRTAEKIFGGASSRVASDVLERMIEGAAGLRSTREFLEGVRLDVRRGGGVEFGKGQGQDRADVAARFNLVVAGSPRLELRTMLGGFRTRLEIPLSSPGIRATLSRPLGGHARANLSAGVEDSGEDRWISANVGLRF